MKNDDAELRKALEGLQRTFVERDRLLKQLVTKMSANMDTIERKAHSRRRDDPYAPGFNEPDRQVLVPGAGEGATPATTREQAERYYRPEHFPDSGKGKPMFDEPRMDRDRRRKTGGRLDGQALTTSRKMSGRLDGRRIESSRKSGVGRLDGQPITTRRTKRQARIL